MVRIRERERQRIWRHVHSKSVLPAAPSAKTTLTADRDVPAAPFSCDSKHTFFIPVSVRAALISRSKAML